MNNFSFFVINYYSDSKTHTAFKDQISNDTLNAYEVNIGTAGNYYFSLHQNDLRSMKGTSKIFSLLSNHF